MWPKFRIIPYYGIHGQYRNTGWHQLQVKTKWWPFWVCVSGPYNSERECTEIMNEYLRGGTPPSYGVPKEIAPSVARKSP